MPDPISRPLRYVLIATLLAVAALGQPSPSTAAAANPPQSTEVLIWQGRILPIVTDAFGSINGLGNAVRANDAGSVAKASDEFAGELLRFRRVAPTPRQVHGASILFEKGLNDLAGGARTLAGGLRGKNTSQSRSGATQVLAGTREFQQAIDQVHRNAGTSAEPAVTLTPAGPVPTPIIRGLP